MSVVHENIQAFIQECITEQQFSYFLTKTYVVGTQKKRLNEHIKHMLKTMGKKIFTILA